MPFDSPTNPLAARPTSYFESDAGRSIGSSRAQRVSPATPFGLVGEFTPELEDQEVEIVCICLTSAMGDVISVRARPDGDQIVYKVLDEYGAELEPGITTSTEPLTGHEVCQLLLEMRMPEDVSPLFHHFFEQMAYETPPESPELVAEGHAFVSIRSDFYPDLNPWLAHWYREWLKGSRSV